LALDRFLPVATGANRISQLFVDCYLACKRKSRRGTFRLKSWLKWHLQATGSILSDDIVYALTTISIRPLVLSVDNKSQIQAPGRNQPGVSMKQERRQTMSHDHKRNGTRTLIAALEPFSENGRIRRVDHRDAAEALGISFAYNCLTDGTFELCAGLMNREETAAVMSDVLGKQIEVALPTREEWTAAAGFPPGEEQWQGMKKLDAYCAKSTGAQRCLRS
jgi:hypothetical protein